MQFWLWHMTTSGASQQW